MAERVLARALELAPAPEDDLTVVAARVSLVDGAAEAPPRPKPSGEWAPAQTAPRGGPAGAAVRAVPQAVKGADSGNTDHAGLGRESPAGVETRIGTAAGDWRGRG